MCATCWRRNQWLLDAPCLLLLGRPWPFARRPVGRCLLGRGCVASGTGGNRPVCLSSCFGAPEALRHYRRIVLSDGAAFLNKKHSVCVCAYIHRADVNWRMSPGVPHRADLVDRTSPDGLPRRSGTGCRQGHVSPDGARRTLATVCCHGRIRSVLVLHMCSAQSRRSTAVGMLPVQPLFVQHALDPRSGGAKLTRRNALPQSFFMLTMDGQGRYIIGARELMEV